MLMAAMVLTRVGSNSEVKVKQQPDILPTPTQNGR